LQDIDSNFGVVSHALKKQGPKTLPHMQAVIDDIFDKPVEHYDLPRTIDFKSWLKPFSDGSLCKLGDSHEIRIAMAPHVAARESDPALASSPGPGQLGAVDSEARAATATGSVRPLPILQSKSLSGDDYQFAPPLGVKPLKSHPTFSVESARSPPSPASAPAANTAQESPVLMLTEVRPLFCGSQPKQKVFVLNDDGTPALEADGRTPKVRYVDVPTSEMDCADNLKSLDKLKDIISDLRGQNTFFNTLDNFPEHTTDAMLSWWSDFDKTQREIITVQERRLATPLNGITCPTLFAAFDNIVLQHKLDEAARHLWLTRQCTAARQRRMEELVETCQYSAASINQRFICPTTTTMEVAEYKDLRELLLGVLPNTPTASRHKPFLVLSCGTDHTAIDSFAGYFGPGSANKAKKSPLLWAWVCEVQQVLEHSEDWTSAKVKVHWYRPAPRSKKQWTCAFWTKGSTIDNHTIVWDVDAPQDPAHWYMEDYHITIGQVVGQFESFQEKNVTEKDENQNVVLDGNGKPKKVKGLFLYPYIQSHCETRCQMLHDSQAGAVAAAAASAGPGPGPASPVAQAAAAATVTPVPAPHVAEQLSGRDSPGGTPSPTTSLANFARGLLSAARGGHALPVRTPQAPAGGHRDLVAGKYPGGAAGTSRPAAKRKAPQRKGQHVERIVRQRR
jgi:hypothetical protein